MPKVMKIFLWNVWYDMCAPSSKCHYLHPVMVSLTPAQEQCWDQYQCYPPVCTHQELTRDHILTRKVMWWRVCLFMLGNNTISIPFVFTHESKKVKNTSIFSFPNILITLQMDTIFLRFIVLLLHSFKWGISYALCCWISFRLMFWLFWDTW